MPFRGLLLFILLKDFGLKLGTLESDFGLVAVKYVLMQRYFPCSAKPAFASHPQTDMAHFIEVNGQIQDYRIQTLDFEPRLVKY